MSNRPDPPRARLPRRLTLLLDGHRGRDRHAYPEQVDAAAVEQAAATITALTALPDHT